MAPTLEEMGFSPEKNDKIRAAKQALFEAALDLSDKARKRERVELGWHRGTVMYSDVEQADDDVQAGYLRLIAAERDLAAAREES